MRHALLSLLIAAPAFGFQHFEARQCHPVALTPDGAYLLALHSRRVRVSFEAATSGATTGENEFDAGPVRGRVEAFVDRRYVSGWRLSSAAILQSDFTTDTVAASRGRPQQFDAPLTRDERLEARLAARIRRTLSQPTADGVE